MPPTDTNTTTGNSQNIKQRMSLAILENWKSWFESAVLFFTALTLLSSWGAILFAKWAASEKDREYARFKEESKVSIANAHAEAENARKDAAQANERAALAHERAAKAELETARLTKQVAPRSISPGQRSQIVAALKGSPSGTVKVNSVAGDGEAMALALQIIGILREAKWSVESAEVIGLQAIGLGIAVQNTNAAPRHAARLIEVFFAAGIPFGVTERPEVPEGTVELWVGNKPGSVAAP